MSMSKNWYSRHSICQTRTHDRVRRTNKTLDTNNAPTRRPIPRFSGSARRVLPYTARVRRFLMRLQCTDRKSRRARISRPGPRTADACRRILPNLEWYISVVWGCQFCRKLGVCSFGISRTKSEHFSGAEKISPMGLTTFWPAARNAKSARFGDDVQLLAISNSSLKDLEAKLAAKWIR